MAPATKSKTGFKVSCSHCRAIKGMSLKLQDVTVECGECSEEVPRRNLQRLIDYARRLIVWLDTAATT
jgi:hypothetical protein